VGDPVGVDLHPDIVIELVNSKFAAPVCRRTNQFMAMIVIADLDPLDLNFSAMAL